METQADSGAAEPLRDREFQKLLKSSSSASLTSEASHNASGEHVGTPSHHGSQVLITEKRQPLSSVSSLEVHFDLLDLTELTDMSDQELGEVFADSDEENHTESPANSTDSGRYLANSHPSKMGASLMNRMLGRGSMINHLAMPYFC
ncbi:dysbindin domain-containing protein 1 isoform X3 [Cyprinus carpio]|uniref:Dysbindin domain-containing protein 1 n=2 Tax=Cyprinus carpio TaxID=7962 RepID=A0A8C1RP86_CYPCA|nr:dysbindin domain-containing protein 1 isoform X3 [Cyprinus carpio]